MSQFFIGWKNLSFFFILIKISNNKKNLLLKRYFMLNECDDALENEMQAKYRYKRNVLLSWKKK